MRAIRYAVLVLVVVLASCKHAPGFAFGDPCSVQMGYPIIPSAYANTIINLTVPLSATCSVSYGNQLYATGMVNDLNTNTSAGTVNTILTSVNGGYMYTGQLGFNLPSSTQGHWVQVAVTIYDAQGNPLTTSGESFQVNSETVQVVTTTVTQSTSSEFANQIPAPPHSIFAYVAIAAILATVIIVTVGLLVYSRRPVTYYQTRTAY